MQKLIALLILFALVSAKYRPELKGQEYQSKNAQEKFEILRQKISQENTSHGKWPSALKLGELFIQDNNNSFLEQDEMPTQGLMKCKRPKLIHIVGTIAEVEYVSVSEKYTGIFSGCMKGFARFSMATEPTKDQIAPGMTFKWMRNGVHSANWFSLFALQGFENDSNIFAKDFTNHIPNINRKFNLSKLKYIALIKSFQKVSDWPAFLGLSDSAKYDEYGNETPKEEIQFPFRLQFQPPKEVRNYFPSDLTEYKDYYYLSLLQGWKVDTIMNVYAQETPDSEELELIGHVRMNTPFQMSSYIDDTMYFQHIRFEDDLKLKPEWTKGAHKVWDWQEKQKNFTYDNIPYE